MLVLSRKVGQKLVVGDNITIVVTRIAGNRVSLALDAPPDVHIVRGELHNIRNEFQAKRSDDSGVPRAAPGVAAPLDGGEAFSAHAAR